MEITEIITMIVQILIGLGMLIGGIAFILKWTFKIDKRLIIIEQKFDELEKNIKNLPSAIENSILKQLLPFATIILNTQNNPLSQEELERMKRLMIKLQNDTITVGESEILKSLLEIEKEEAEKKNNANLLLAVTIALGVIALLWFDKKK